MKQATCHNLRGACAAVITGETAAAMGAASKQHVMQMLQAGDAAHKQAMDAMLQLSQRIRKNGTANLWPALLRCRMP